MEARPKLTVSFRKSKVELDLQPDLTVHAVKAALLEAETESGLAPSDIKLLYKGKVLDSDDEALVNILKPAGKKQYKMIAMGRSSNEVKAIQGEQAEARERAPRVRDDLTQQGLRDAERRKRLGRQMMQKAAQNQRKDPSAGTHGFGRIETLPNLPDQEKVRAILTELANDPGILACMKKHKWNVGSLAELYPEGKVGQTAVCVMGLNRNKGQQILLRVRTDDLKGFRKMLSIRKVLFHELAHNVHSEHDGKFFQLMRQIEKECNEMDWTQGSGLSANDAEMQSYSGGTFRLGGSESNNNKRNMSARELRAQAALSRMTKEEEEIQQHCGCGRTAKFLPPGLQPDGDMDLS